MTWTYNNADLTTSLNRVRRLIGDVNSTSPLFTDEEINFYIDENASIYSAAAIACQSLAAEYADAVTKSVGPLSITMSDKFKHYNSLASQFTVQASQTGTPQLYAGGISKADKLTKEQDTDRDEPWFSRDMDDYIESTTT